MTFRRKNKNSIHFHPIWLDHTLLHYKGGVLFTCEEELLIEVFNSIVHCLFIAKNQNFSNLLLEIVIDVILNSNLTTPSKEATETTAHSTHSKCHITDSPVDISGKLTNQLQQQILIFQNRIKK